MEWASRVVRRVTTVTKARALGAAARVWCRWWRRSMAEQEQEQAKAKAGASQRRGTVRARAAQRARHTHAPWSNRRAHGARCRRVLSDAQRQRPDQKQPVGWPRRMNRGKWGGRVELEMAVAQRFRGPEVQRHSAAPAWGTRRRVSGGGGRWRSRNRRRQRQRQSRVPLSTPRHSAVKGGLKRASHTRTHAPWSNRRAHGERCRCRFLATPSDSDQTRSNLWDGQGE